MGNEQLGRQPEIWGSAKLHSRRTRYRPLGFPAGFWRNLPGNPTVLHTWARPNSTSGSTSSSRRQTFDECAARTDARMWHIDTELSTTAIAGSTIPETGSDSARFCAVGRNSGRLDRLLLRMALMGLSRVRPICHPTGMPRAAPKCRNRIIYVWNVGLKRGAGEFRYGARGQYPPQ